MPETELLKEHQEHLKSWTEGDPTEYAPCVLGLSTSEGNKLRTEKSFMVFKKNTMNTEY